MVDEAKAKALFQDLPAGREKGEVIWLMELASVEERRPHAMQALLWLQQQREDGRAGDAA